MFLQIACSLLPSEFLFLYLQSSESMLHYVLNYKNGKFDICKYSEISIIAVIRQNRATLRCPIYVVVKIGGIMVFRTCIVEDNSEARDTLCSLIKEYEKNARGGGRHF